MDVVLGQDPLQESDVRLDDSRIKIVDELRQLALVASRIPNGPTTGREQENRDREEILHHPTSFHRMTLKDTSSSINASRTSCRTFDAKWNALRNGESHHCEQNKSGARHRPNEMKLSSRAKKKERATPKSAGISTAAVGCIA